MLEILTEELRHIGLSLSAKKSKILTTAYRHCANETSFVEVAGEFIEILPFWASHRYLGRMINLASDERNSFEISHRRQVIWHVFHKYSRTLCNQNISLKKRLRLFDACVSLVILFGAAVLPLTRGELINYDVIQKNAQENHWLGAFRRR